MSLGVAAGVVAQLALLFVVGAAVADRLAVVVFRGRAPGTPERALLAVAGFVAFSCALMIANAVSGGGVFGNAFVIPLAALVVVVSAVRGGVRVPRPRLHPGWLLVAVLVALYVVPVLVAGSGIRTGDAPWHLGWTEQILHGEPLPTGPAPEFARNAYPWGLHATQATLVRLVPGSDAVMALEALHLALVAALPLAAACLARRVRGDAGWGAAVAMSCVGGWGWLLARGPAFVPTPLEARFGADLVVASPNAVYEMFPPAFPRELALVIAAGSALCLLISLREASRPALLAAGALAGIAGLVNVPMFLAAVSWGAVATVTRPARERVRFGVRFFGAAFLGFLPWASTMIVDYFRFGGFVNITERLGVEWPLRTSLAAWGVLLPFALAGAWLVIRKGGPERTLVLMGAAGVALLGFALARARFDWTLQGNATLLHQGRVWPGLHLVGAALAGVAFAALWRALASRSRGVALLVATVTLALGLASPVLASIAFTGILEREEAGFVYASDDVSEGSFVRRAAAHLSPDDVLAVTGGDEVRTNRLAFFLWQFSGARLGDFGLLDPAANPLRIRFGDLVDGWRAQMEAGGFEPDYVVMPAEEAPADAEPLESGDFRGLTWVLLPTD